MELKKLQGDVTLSKLNSINACSGLSNKALCILITQGGTKQLEVKYGGPKKFE